MPAVTPDGPGAAGAAPGSRGPPVIPAERLYPLLWTALFQAGGPHRWTMGCRDGRSPAVRAGEREVEAPRTSCMRRTLLALAISVLFLAGCAQTTTHTPVAKAPPSTPEVHVAAVDGIVGVSPDGLSLHLTAPVGAPCSGRLGTATGLVREDTAEVVVLLSVNGLPEAPSHSQPCPAVLPVQAVCVRLNRPLGDRAVIDGATGRPLIRRELH